MSDDFLQIAGAVAAGVWVIGWIPLFILVCAVTGTENNVGWEGQTFLAVWFGVPLLGALCFGLFMVWRVRPRRVTEPVREDLRNARKRGAA